MGSASLAMSNTDHLGELCGIPYEPSKREGPESTLVFLGTEFDCIAIEARLPHDKILKGKNMIFQSFNTER